MKREVINPWAWQDKFGFVQANQIGSAQCELFCAGQASLDADGKPVHPGDMRAQIAQSLDNLETVLAQANMTLADVVRLTWYVTDVDAYREVATHHRERLAQAGCKAAATLLGVTRLAYPELMVEIEATAVR